MSYEWDLCCNPPNPLGFTTGSGGARAEALFIYRTRKKNRNLSAFSLSSSRLAESATGRRYGAWFRITKRRHFHVKRLQLSL